MKFVVEGDNPVTLTVYIDGSQAGRYLDRTYLLDEGGTILGCSYDGSSEPDWWFDNFTADDLNTAVESASLGEIKATYR